MNKASMTRATTLVLGVGNLLMGDEGVGLRVVRRLSERPSDPRVEVVDGGTGGLALLGSFEGRDLVILVDAVMDGKPPGSVSVLKPVFSRDYPRTLVAHDIGLKDVLDALALLDRRPEIRLVTISIAQAEAPSLELSAAVEAAVEPAAAAVLGLLPAAGAA